MYTWQSITKQAVEAKRKLVCFGDYSGFEVLLNALPNDGMIHYFLGLAYIDMGENDDARKELEIAKELFPMLKWKEKCDEALRELVDDEDLVIF